MPSKLSAVRLRGTGNLQNPSLSLRLSHLKITPRASHISRMPACASLEAPSVALLAKTRLEGSHLGTWATPSLKGQRTPALVELVNPLPFFDICNSCSLLHCICWFTSAGYESSFGTGRAMAPQQNSHPRQRWSSERFGFNANTCTSPSGGMMSVSTTVQGGDVAHHCVQMPGASPYGIPGLQTAAEL